MGQKGGKGQGLDTKKKHVNKEHVFNEYNVNMVMDFNAYSVITLMQIVYQINLAN